MNPTLVTVAAVLLAGVAWAGVPAQQSARDPLRVSAFKNGVFGLSLGGVKTSVRLEGIAGCTSGTYDGSDPRSRPSGGEAEARVLDLVQKSGFWYLTFQTTLNSGCNVQGFCGAGSAVSLVWLKLESSLRVVGQRVEILQNCVSNTLLTRWSGRSTANASDAYSPKLELRSGVLELTYESNDYDKKVNTVSNLVYEHRAPERGFKVSSVQAPLKP